MFAGILKKVSIRKYLLYFGTILHFNPILLIPLFHPCFIWTPLVCISSLADICSFQTAFSSVLLIYFLLLKKTQRYTMSCFPKLSAVTNKCWSPGATHRAAALPNPCVCVCVCVCVWLLELSVYLNSLVCELWVLMMTAVRVAALLLRCCL